MTASWRCSCRRTRSPSALKCSARTATSSASSAGAAQSPSSLRSSTSRSSRTLAIRLAAVASLRRCMGGSVHECVLALYTAKLHAGRITTGRPLARWSRAGVRSTPAVWTRSSSLPRPLSVPTARSPCMSRVARRASQQWRMLHGACCMPYVACCMRHVVHSLHVARAAPSRPPVRPQGKARQGKARQVLCTHS